LRLRTQTRLLPTAAINEALEERLEAYRERMQEEPGRREKRKLKEQTRDELLPKALLKSERTGGFVIATQRLIADPIEHHALDSRHRLLYTEANDI
jgi:recombination associated protein RdgC